jgi:hypothetical protein
MSSPGKAVLVIVTIARIPKIVLIRVDLIAPVTRTLGHKGTAAEDVWDGVAL